MLLIPKRGGLAAPSPAINYILVSSQAGSITSYNNTFNGLSAPLSGQKARLLILSKLAPATCLINSVAATLIDQENVGSSAAFASLYEQSGWESTSLNVQTTYSSGSAFQVLHGWRTFGWDFDAASLVAAFSATSSTGDLSVTLSKPAGGISCLGGRFQSNPIGATITEDFDNGAGIWAGRIMTEAAVSGSVTFDGPASAQSNRMCAAFDLIPE
jgi:hypothetical protein